MPVRKNIIQLRQELAERFPSCRPGENPRKAELCSTSGIAALDQLLGGGLPAGALTEIVAPHLGCGSALFIRAQIEQAARAHTPLALIDSHTSFDPASVPAASLPRLLWVQCQEVKQAVKAAELLVLDGNLISVVLDLALCPPADLRKIPAPIWYRLQRAIEERTATLVIITPQPCVGSARLRLGLRHSFRLDDLNTASETLLNQLHFEVLLKRAVTPFGALAQTG